MSLVLWLLLASTTAEPGLFLRDFALPLPLYAPTSAWRTPASRNATAQSVKQVTAMFEALLGSTAGAQFGSSLPILSAVPAALPCYAGGGCDVPIYRAMQVANRTITVTVPLLDYSGRPTTLADTQSFPVANTTVTVPAPYLFRLTPSEPRSVTSAGAAVILDQATGVEWDLAQVTTLQTFGVSLGGGYPGTMNAVAQVALFDTTAAGPGRKPDGVSSTLTTGLPLLGGLLVPEDFAGGAIEHALAAGFPQLRNQNAYYHSNPVPVSPNDFFAPASGGIATSSSWRQYAVAPGQRLRLRDQLFDVNGQLLNETLAFSPVTRMVVAALRKFGVIMTRVTPGFFLETESTITANMDPSLAASLLGSSLLPAGSSAWSEVMARLTRELAAVPMGVPASGNVAVKIPSLSLDLSVQLGSVNWDVVSGTVGREAIGEGFIQDYDYAGSISVVLIILAVVIFVPTAMGIALWIINPCKS